MERVGAMVFLIIAASLITVSTGRPWNAEEDFARKLESSIHVAGKVLCQDCAEGWNAWVNGSQPINGTKVSITCFDSRKKVVYYGSDLTDNIGHFEIIIKKYMYGKVIDPKKCFLRLVSSPDPICHIPTDFAGGKSGVKLRRPTMVYRDITKYVVGPFYYTTPMCDEPDTSNEEQVEERDNY